MKLCVKNWPPSNRLPADEVVHFSLALMVGLILTLVFSSPILILFSLLMGFFIDADHLVDYLYCFFHLDKETIKKNFFNLGFHLSHFFAPEFYVQKNRKVFVPLHGWEYLIIFWLILGSLGKKFGLVGLEWTTLAYLAHLSWDQYTCAGQWRSYFFTHRLLNRFSYQAYFKNSDKLS